MEKEKHNEQNQRCTSRILKLEKELDQTIYSYQALILTLEKQNEQQGMKKYFMTYQNSIGVNNWIFSCENCISRTCRFRYSSIAGSIDNIKSQFTFWKCEATFKPSLAIFKFEFKFKSWSTGTVKTRYT